MVLFPDEEGVGALCECSRSQLSLADQIRLILAQLTRTELHEAHASPITTEVLERIGSRYEIESEIRGRPYVCHVLARTQA